MSDKTVHDYVFDALLGYCKEFEKINTEKLLQNAATIADAAMEFSEPQQEIVSEYTQRKAAGIAIKNFEIWLRANYTFIVAEAEKVVGNDNSI